MNTLSDEWSRKMKDNSKLGKANGYVDVSNFSRGSQCILGSLGGKQSCFCITML